MGNYINLREPGSSHTLRVQSVDINKSGKWPDYEFTDGTDTVQVPQKAADRQLARLNVKTAFELVGATLCISRTEKTGDNGKPFWDLELVSEAEANPQPSRRLPPPERASRTTKTAHRAGPDIPGMDEAMEEEGPYAHDEREYESDYQGDEGVAHVRHQHRAQGQLPGHPPDAPLVGDEPPLIPREVREREAQAKGDATPADRFLDWYIDTYAKMLAGLSAVHTAAVSANVGPRSREAEAIPSLTSDTVQAAVATYTIQCEKRGWFR